MQFPYTIIDLTHTIDANIPTWEGECGFEHRIQSDYAESTGEVKFRIGAFKMLAGIGTHLDAPAHCIPGGMTIDQIPLAQLMAPCLVIDISSHCHADYRISADDIKNFERQFSPIPPGAFVMFKTGWECFWLDPEKYRNHYQFPSISKDAALMLLEKQVCGLAIDTLSPDRPEDGYPVHQLFLQAGKWIVENAANLHLLPPIGSFILPVPIKVKQATEAPIRLLAFLPNVPISQKYP
jgi:kynurenine formamidase